MSEKDLQVAPKDLIWQKPTSLAEIKKIYGAKLSDGEFTTLCQIGQATGLNPFLREIWAVKYGNAPASIFIGRDGYRKAAQDNPDYDYHIVDAVYENDDFNMEESIVKHNYSIKDRGKLAGAYCIVKRKGASKPMFIFVELGEYYQGNKDENGNIKTGKYGPMKPTLWDTKPATMIKKVAEAQGLRMTFQSMFAGTYDESENWEKEQPQKVEIIDKKEEPTKLQNEHFAYILKKLGGSKEAMEKAMGKVWEDLTQVEAQKWIAALEKKYQDKPKTSEEFIEGLEEDKKKMGEVQNEPERPEKEDGDMDIQMEPEKATSEASASQTENKINYDPDNLGKDKIVLEPEIIPNTRNSESKAAQAMAKAMDKEIKVKQKENPPKVETIKESDLEGDKIFPKSEIIQ